MIRNERLLSLLGAMIAVFYGADASAQDAIGPTLRLQGMSIGSASGGSTGPTLSLEDVAIKPWSGAAAGPTLRLEVGKGAETAIPEPGVPVGIFSGAVFCGLMMRKRHCGRID